MPSASGCSARRSNPPTTPSSRCRSTAPSPAGIRRRSGCSDTARRKPWARTSRCSCPTTGCRRSQDTLRRIGWGESIEHNETVRLRKDGSPIEVSLSISPIKSSSGATIGISKVARDITESNKTRQALRQQTEELRRIFETSQDLIMVMDRRGLLVQISPSCEAILGYRPEEMIGRSGDRLHPSRPSRELPRGNARGAARAAPEDFRYALHSQGRARGVAVLARDMVRAGQAVLLRRPRHDREPAGAGDAARKRAAGARHHRHRARRLRPDRRAGHHPGLEFAGRKDLRLVAR